MFLEDGEHLVHENSEEFETSSCNRGVAMSGLVYGQ